MKKILSTLLLSALCTMASFAAFSDGVSIKFGDDEMNEGYYVNYSNSSITSGFVSYDKDNHILYLYGVTIESTATTPALSIKGTAPVTIIVEGSCEIKSSGAGANAFETQVPVTLSTIGGGDILFQSVNNRGMVLSKDLTINNGLSVKVKGSSYGIIGVLTDSKLPKIIMDGSYLIAESAGYGISSIAGVDLTDCELPSDLSWNSEIGAIVKDTDPYSEYTGTVEIVRSANVYYLRLTSSEFGGGKVSVWKDGAQVSNPYKHKTAEQLTLKAENTTGFKFVQYNDMTKTAEYTVTTVTYADEEWVAQYVYEVQSEKPWYVMDGTKLRVFTNHLSASEDKGELYGLASSNYVTSACVATSGENVGQFVFASQTSSTQSAVKTREFDKTYVGKTVAITNLAVAQTDYNPIYAVAYSPLYDAFYCAAKRVSDGKTVLVLADANTNTLTFQKLLSMNEPVTAMTVSPDGTFYFIGENDDNASLYSLTPVLGITLSSWTNYGKLGVGSNNSTKRNSIAVDPYTGELLWFQSSTYTRSLRAIDVKTGVSHYIADQEINASGMFQMNEMVTISVKSNDPEKGLVTMTGLSTQTNCAKGSEISFGAYPTSDGRFIKWDDGSTEAVRTVIATETKTYTAEFDWKEGYVQYPIWVSDVQMRTGKLNLSKTYTSVIKNGNLIFDPETNTLTMNNLEIESAEYNAIVLGSSSDNMQPLTINLVGTNKITHSFSNGQAIAINNWNTTFTGSGSLNISCTLNSDALGLDASDLTFEGANVVITANKYGIIGSSSKKESVLVKGSNLKVKGGQGSFLKLKDMKWEYCSITAPTGGTIAFNTTSGQLEKDGELIKVQVVFESLPMLRCVPLEPGTGSFTITWESEVFTDVAWIPKNENITITAIPAAGYEFARWTFNSEWGDESQKDKWVEATFPTTMADGVNELKAVFYYKPKSTATWYAINGGKYVSFTMNEHASKKSAAKDPSAAGISAGDYRKGSWDCRTSIGITTMPFNGLTDGEDLSGKDNIETVLSNGTLPIYDMGYDVLHDVMYAVGNYKLYRIDYSGKQIVTIGDIKDNEGYFVNAYGVAVDAKGVIYILQKSTTGVQGKLFTVANMDESLGKVEVEPVGGKDGKIGMEVSLSQQSLAFDFATGELFWASNDYMRILDTQTAQARIVGDLGMTQGNQGETVSLHRMNKLVTVSVNVAEGCEEMGSVSASKTKVAQGTSVTITATPKEGYKFTYWHKGSDTETRYEEATYTFKANSNSTWYAHFSKKSQDIDEIGQESKVESQKIIMNGQLLIIRDGKVYNALGQRIE